jgi:hypothetical protein
MIDASTGPAQHRLLVLMDNPIRSGETKPPSLFLCYHCNLVSISMSLQDAYDGGDSVREEEDKSSSYSTLHFEHIIWTLDG